MVDQQAQGLWREAGDGPALFQAEAPDEGVRQIGNVLSASAQGWRLDGEHIQPVEEILTEGTFGDGPGEVAVGCRDDPDIHLDRPAGADRIHLALLQDAQELDLHVQGKLADLVEKQGSAVRFLELPGMAFRGAREAALLVAEQDGLDERLGDGPAVHSDEGPASAVRRAVHRPGDDFLADPAFPGDQHRDRRPRRPLAHPADMAHGGGCAHQIAEGRPAFRSLAQLGDLRAQRPDGQGVVDRDGDALWRGRLDEEVRGPGLHGLDHGVYAAGSRQHDDRLLMGA